MSNLEEIFDRILGIDRIEQQAEEIVGGQQLFYSSEPCPRCGEPLNEHQHSRPEGCILLYAVHDEGLTFDPDDARDALAALKMEVQRECEYCENPTVWKPANSQGLHWDNWGWAVQCKLSAPPAVTRDKQRIP